jgi:transcriptional regulator with XRE-family HTH domain
LTQLQLAELVGIDNRTISRIENGVHATDVDMIARLAHGLRVPSWRFFREE